MTYATVATRITVLVNNLVLKPSNIKTGAYTAWIYKFFNKTVNIKRLGLGLSLGAI